MGMGGNGNVKKPFPHISNLQWVDYVTTAVNLHCTLSVNLHMFRLSGKI